MRDLDFISGRFFEFEIPKDKRYLLKYFTGDLQVMFLRYYMVFGNSRNFTEHTGFKCDKSVLSRFEKRYRDLTKFYNDSKSAFTEKGLENISLIESGKLKLTQLNKL